MPYKIGWYIPDEIVFVRYEGSPNIEEMRTCMQQMNSYYAQGKRALVHVIVDLTYVTQSASVVDLAQAVRGYTPDPHAGWSVNVGEKDKLIKFTSSIARQLLHLRQRSYETLPEALDFLRDIDSSLNWSAADNSILEYAPQTGEVP